MGGMFVNKSATELSVVASKAAIEAAGVQPEKIDSVVFGHVLMVGTKSIRKINVKTKYLIISKTLNNSYLLFFRILQRMEPFYLDTHF